MDKNDFKKRIYDGFESARIPFRIRKKFYEGDIYKEDFEEVLKETINLKLGENIEVEELRVKRKKWAKED